MKLKVGSPNVYIHIVDILNQVFGCTYKGYQRGYWEKAWAPMGVWFPQSSRDPKDAKSSDKKFAHLKFRNIFRKNDDEVVEYWPSAQVTRMHQIQVGDRRAVFAKFVGKGDYVFMGVYEFEAFEGSNGRVYKRVAKEIDVNDFMRKTK